MTWKHPTTNSQQHPCFACTSRHELFPGYKAQRPPTPEGLFENVGQVLQMVAAMGTPILCVPGVEADDVIGSLAKRMEREGADIVIVSSDKVGGGWLLCVW